MSRRNQPALAVPATDEGAIALLGMAGMSIAEPA